jgi:deoxyribodipyrimidine photolyase-related protein
MTLWLLGDQLRGDAPALAEADRVLMIEAHAFADRKPYHPQKLTLVLSAMRHFRDELRAAGHTVEYQEAETFGEGLDEHFEAHPGDTLELYEPPSHGAGERFAEMVEARVGDLRLLENDLYLTTRSDWEAWASERSGDYRQENWYRHVRRETGYLMDGGDPVGGEWNYDDQNRETPPDDWEPPAAPAFEADEVTEAVREFVAERYDDHWGEASDPGTEEGRFRWPVTRDQALDALDDFLGNRLSEFGPYQDAMVTDEWALSHSLLSTSLNLGLLTPEEVVERAVGAYREGDAPLNSVEGFLRQVVGWREFMRHVYREEMPGMAGANQLDAERDLPPLFWDGETEMQCMSEAVNHVRERGYAHHIERLMLLSNFATTYGVDPTELNEWFHLGFVDAFHWVTTPNVVGMGTFGTDALSSKPYAASANYVDGMSDHCGECPYAKTKTTGENACPFNSLYWDFLAANEERLRETGRMGLVYSHLDDKRGEELAEIRDRAAEVREQAADGTL